MKIIIRNIINEDLQYIKKLNEKFLPENYCIELWNIWFIIGIQYSFIAQHDDKIIGYIMCNGDKILSFAIDDKYRHMGIGTQLLLNCLSSVTNQNLILTCRASNILAQKLYKKYGFEITELLEKHYTNPKDDGYIMERKIQPINNLVKKEIIIDKNYLLEKLKKDLKII